MMRLLRWSVLAGLVSAVGLRPLERLPAGRPIAVRSKVAHRTLLVRFFHRLKTGYW